MSHSPSHEGALRMRCGLDELVFPLEGRVLASGVLAAINGAQQPLLPCCLEPCEGQALLVYNVGGRLRLAKLLRQPGAEIQLAACALRQLCLTMQALPACGVDVSGLSFCPDHVFWDAEEKKPYFVCLPFAGDLTPEEGLRGLTLALFSQVCPGASQAHQQVLSFLDSPGFTVQGLCQVLDLVARQPQQSAGAALSRSMEIPLYPPAADYTSTLDGTLASVASVGSATSNLYELQRQQMMAAAKRARTGVRLRITSGQHSSEVDIAELPCVIGRSPELAQLVLEDPQLSRRHAVLEQEGGQLCIRDLGSKNGLSVDGVHYPAGQDVPLEPGSTMTLGQTLLSVVSLVENISPN